MLQQYILLTVDMKVREWNEMGGVCGVFGQKNTSKRLELEALQTERV